MRDAHNVNLWCVQVQYVVLDEADTMLDVGFADDIERILSDVPASRQTLLFSATMPQWVQKLTQRYQRNPLLVDLIGETGAQSGKLADNIRCPTSPFLPVLAASPASACWMHCYTAASCTKSLDLSGLVTLKFPSFAIHRKPCYRHSASHAVFACTGADSAGNI